MKKTLIIAEWGHFPSTHPNLVPVILKPLADRLIRKHQDVCGDETFPENLVFGAIHHLLQRRYLITNLVTAALIGLLIGYLSSLLPEDVYIHEFLAGTIACVVFLSFQNWRSWCKPQSLSASPKNYPLAGVVFITRHKLFFEFAECCQLVHILFFNWNDEKSAAGQAILSDSSDFNYLEHELWVHFQEYVLQRCKELAILVTSTSADEVYNIKARAALKFFVEKSVEYKLIKLGEAGAPRSVNAVYKNAFADD